LTKVTDHMGKEVVVKRLKSKSGPCILQLLHDRLREDWECT